MYFAHEGRREKNIHNKTKVKLSVTKIYLSTVLHYAKYLMQNNTGIEKASYLGYYPTIITTFNVNSHDLAACTFSKSWKKSVKDVQS